MFLPPIPPRVWSQLLWALLSAIALLSWADPAARPSLAQPEAPPATVEAELQLLQRQVDALSQQLAQGTLGGAETRSTCKNEKNLKSPPVSPS